MKDINSQDFQEEVIHSEIPVIVDFWAERCGPCRALKPILEVIDRESNNQFKVVKVDVDDNMDLAATYRISGIPTLIVFKNGKEVNRLVGLQNKEKLLEAVLNG